MNDPLVDILIQQKTKPGNALTEAERSLMRAALIEVVQEAPAGGLPIPSPYFSVFMRPQALAALVLIFALIGGTSVAASANDALPGDALYSVKVGVNEPLARTLAFSNTAKADIDIAHAEERLREVELLAATGDSIRAEDAAEKASGTLASIRERLRSRDGGDDAEARLSLALAAHADILDAQAEDEDGNEHISFLALAREARFGERAAEASASRTEDIIERAKDRIKDKDIDADTRDALLAELALVEEELAGGQAEGSVAAIASAERHAYRVLTLAEAARRIAEKTGKDVFIRFSGNEGKGSANSGKSTAAAFTATAAKQTSEDARRGSDEDEQDDDRFDRKVEFRVIEKDDDTEDKDEDSHSGSGSSGGSGSSKDNSDHDSDDDHSGSGSGDSGGGGDSGSNSGKGGGD